MLLQANEISLSYGERCILDKASFCASEGEFVGIYGPSGCGKSTLNRLLCGLHPPRTGEVLLDGALLVSEKQPYDRARGLAIQPVYQQPYSSLDFNQRIGRGLRELIRYHGFASGRKETEELCDQVLEQVGLERDILRHRPHQISGGEAQRIALARALLFRPRLLILDEATSMLDVSTQANVLALVRRITERSGGAVLFISHDRTLTEHLCDRIYEFENMQLKEKNP
ncbi:MAG: dipeptide/oligopeptide/nickel ABC transporter ATP-binding protein [Oscillospiraceae bacterium]|nr:dipeptide/oligopeptide/nickel ABC transporter ATP-binding protein [Oscillospiraceae bacterium]